MATVSAIIGERSNAPPKEWQNWVMSVNDPSLAERIAKASSYLVGGFSDMGPMGLGRVRKSRVQSAGRG